MRGRGCRAGSCGRGSTIAANPRRTAGRTSARNTASSTPAASRRTRSTTTSHGGPRSRCCTCFRTGTGRAWKGKEIAVWVHSNLDRVELLLNGQSLGAKDVKKDSHLAWIVKYAPGTIEARGYKDGKLAMTDEARDHRPCGEAGDAADRAEIAADGEDVAIFAVEVQDAQGRVVPITDNEVTFQVTGTGKLLGTGNGDPTNQEPDTGTSRKAFSGWCMAVVQSTKKSGEITVEASSPGLAPATVTIAAKEVKLRPQVAVWEREVPKGPGVTGLWRPAPQEANELTAFLGGNDMVFTLRQEGSSLSGTVEGGNVNFAGGGDVPVPIENGKVEGESISFKAGRRTFTGTVKGGRIDLDQKIEFPFKRPEPKPESPNRPAVGPAPDESDPSINWGRRRPREFAITIQRVER